MSGKSRWPRAKTKDTPRSEGSSPRAADFDEMVTIPWERIEEPDQGPAASLPKLHIVWNPNVRALVS